jgi:hypothetical protein
MTQVRDALTALFPDGRHVTGQSTFNDGRGWIELNYRTSGRANPGQSDFVDSIGVRSSGDESSMVILRVVCEQLDLRMYDCQTGEIADFEDETKQSMDAFREFRDKAIGKRQPDE